MSNKLGSLITSEPEVFDPAITDSAKFVFLMTSESIPEVFGLRIVKERNNLRDILADQLGRLRGKELFGIVAPDVKLPSDFSKLYSIMNDRTDMNWAFYGEPGFVAMTTGLIPHILHRIESTKLNPEFPNGDWHGTLVRFFKNNVMPHKVFEVTELLGLTALNPPSIVQEEAALAPEPAVQVTRSKKKKKK